MMAVDYFARHAALNPVPEADALPDSAWTDAVLLDAIDRRTAGEPGMRGLLVPPERPRRGPLVAVAVMALVLIIGVVTLVTAVSGPDSAGEPEPTTPSTTQPQPSPDLSGDSGTVDSLLGALPWVHASGGESLLPSARSVIQTPTGFAGVVDTEDSLGRERSEWATSADGVTWTLEPFPVPLDGFNEIGGTNGSYWMTDETGVWLSEDAENWTRVDLSTVAPPASTGLLWDSGVERAEIVGPVTVFFWRAHPKLPLREIFNVPSTEFSGGVIASNCTWYWDPPCSDADAADEYVVLGRDGETDQEIVLARFRLESDGDTVVVVDADTGIRIHEFTLGGFSGDELAAAMGTDFASWSTVGVVGADLSVTVVEPPWPSFGIRSVEIVAVDGRFLAYVDTGDPHGPTKLDDIEVWESRDGITWTSRGAVDFGIGLPGEMHVLQLFERRGHLAADIEYDLDRFEPPTIRVLSTDGFNWEPTRPTAPAFAVEPVRNGFIAVNDRVWVSADGSNWEELNILDRASDTAFVVGDTLIVAYESDGTYESWAFDLEP